MRASQQTGSTTSSRVRGGSDFGFSCEGGWWSRLASGLVVSSSADSGSSRWESAPDCCSELSVSCRNRRRLGSRIGDGSEGERKTAKRVRGLPSADWRVWHDLQWDDETII